MATRLATDIMSMPRPQAASAMACSKVMQTLGQTAYKQSCVSILLTASSGHKKSACLAMDQAAVSTEAAVHRGA